VPSDPLGEVIDSWKEWVVDRSHAHRGRVVRYRGCVYGFLVYTSYLHRLSDDRREELERDALEGNGYAAEHAAARLAVDRELEHFFEQVDAGFPGAAGIYERYAEVSRLVGMPIRIDLPEEELRGLKEEGAVERESLNLGAGPPGEEEVKVFFYVRRPELLPEELKLDYFESWIRPLLRGLARLLAPAYFGRVNCYIHVYFA